jgi:hypothetical protein
VKSRLLAFAAVEPRSQEGLKAFHVAGDVGHVPPHYNHVGDQLPKRLLHSSQGGGVGGDGRGVAREDANIISVLSFHPYDEGRLHDDRFAGRLRDRPSQLSPAPRLTPHANVIV